MWSHQITCYCGFCWIWCGDLLFYGTLNPPKFYIDNVEIDDVIHSTNNENNIKFYFKDESGKSNAWCWGFGETYEKLGSPKKVNIVFELEPFFNGQVVIKIDEMENGEQLPLDKVFSKLILSLFSNKY